MYKTGENKSVVSLAGAVILTLLMGIAVWAPAFISSPAFLLTQGGGALYRAITPLFTPYIASVITIVLLIGMGVFLCWQASHYRLVRTTSVLPVFFMLFLPGLFLSEHGISPGVPACLCLLVAFSRIIAGFHSEDAQWRSLEMGLFIALATLFAPTYAYYIPLCWIGMHLLNRLTFQNLLAFIVGLITPYLLYIGFLLLTDQANELQHQWDILSHQFCIEWLWNMHETVLLCLIGIALVVALIGFLHQHTDRIHPRAIVSFAFVLSWGAFVLSLLYHNAHHILPLCLFASLLLTQYFYYRSKKITTLFFYAFIGSCLFVYLTQFAA
ncbi:MAG: hypothetical protein IKC81_00295 [Paludibacteraceae bacterium]|nr:hypothetical protein [Paludibacteraceae bacterium]